MAAFFFALKRTVLARIFPRRCRLGILVSAGKFPLPPADGLTCGINLSHTVAEFQVVLDAVPALAASRGMVPAMDRQEYSDQIDRFQDTRWDSQTETIRLVELKNLVGTPWGGAFDVLQLSIDRRQQAGIGESPVPHLPGSVPSGARQTLRK